MREIQAEDIELVEVRARFAAKRSGVDWEELRSLAWPGLLQAAKTWDHTKGASFRTHASRRIDGAIKDGLRNEYGTAQSGRDRHMRRRPVFSGEMREDRMPEPWRHGPDHEQIDYVQWLLRMLPRKYAQAYRLYYFEGLSLKDVGHYMGVTDGRVLQMLRYGRKMIRETVLGEAVVPARPRGHPRLERMQRAG